MENLRCNWRLHGNVHGWVSVTSKVIPRSALTREFPSLPEPQHLSPSDSQKHALAHINARQLSHGSSRWPAGADKLRQARAEGWQQAKQITWPPSDGDLNVFVPTHEPTRPCTYEPAHASPLVACTEPTFGVIGLDIYTLAGATL